MGSGRPSFSLTCYKTAEESQPVTVIPLDNARVVVETGVFTEAGILVISLPKLLNAALSLTLIVCTSCSQLSSEGHAGV